MLFLKSSVEDNIRRYRTNPRGELALGSRPSIRLSVAIAIFASVAIACQAAPGEIPLRLLPGAGIPDGKEIKSYPVAVDAIVRTMVQKFQLPEPRGLLLIYLTREEFELGLVEHLKITSGLAKSTARFAKSAVGGYNVLVNEQAIADSSWPERVELLAHELMHAVQLTLARRPGLPRHQWLMEGSAEWMAFKGSNTRCMVGDNASKAAPASANTVSPPRGGTMSP